MTCLARDHMHEIAGLKKSAMDEFSMALCILYFVSKRQADCYLFTFKGFPFLNRTIKAPSMPHAFLNASASR